MPIRLSISIVIFKQNLDVLNHLFACLKIALKKTLQDFAVTCDVWVIDNDPLSCLEADIQNIAERNLSIPGVITFQYKKTGKNIGYGAANNIVIKNCDSTYHLIMNPDVFVAEDCLLNAIYYMQRHQDIGLLSPAAYGEDGSRHYLCKKNPTLFDMYLRSFAPGFIKKLYKQRMLEFEMRDKDYDQEIFDAPFLTGCFMFFRTEVLKKINGFDERFFLYFEDTDLSRRVLDISHSAYVPQVKVVHQWARESRRKFKMLCIFIHSAFLYWKKHGGFY